MDPSLIETTLLAALVPTTALAQYSIKAQANLTYATVGHHPGDLGGSGELDLGE